MGRWLVATGSIPGISGDNNIEVTDKDSKDTVSIHPKEGDTVLPGVGYNNTSNGYDEENNQSKVVPLINAEQTLQDCNQKV